jgi:hypothetical protein
MFLAGEFSGLTLLCRSLKAGVASGGLSVEWTAAKAAPEGQQVKES